MPTRRKKSVRTSRNRSSSKKKKLLLFVHGITGSAKETWGDFPELIRSDPEVARQYNVATFEYPSHLVCSDSGLADKAAILKTQIENVYRGYPEIALIAHSQGGLLAKYYIAETIISRAQPLRVTRLLTFATPHQGSGFATVAKKMPLSSQEVKNLDPNSEFMRALAVAWGQSKAYNLVLTKSVVAESDAIVGKVSAMGSWSPDYEVIGGEGHLSIVKPKTKDDNAFLIAKNFLLADSLIPGGVEADYQAPLLRFNSVSPRARENARFIYSTLFLPFFGRNAEWTSLTAFLGDFKEPFRWMVMHGSGGVGKSRLALELCLAMRDEWHAGFLSQEGQEPDWGRWQPLMPTLIIIDYAARDPKRTGKLIKALAGRGPADGTSRLAAPVRVLLLERTGAGEWLDQIVGAGTVELMVDQHRTPNLLLETISDPWPIFKFVLNKAGKPLPDKSETLATLGQIDPERRPLFAHLLADTIAAGHDPRHFDANSLLDQVIKRECTNFWVPAGATAKEKRLLAVITMAGGLPVSAVKGIEEALLPSWDVDLHPKVFMAMTGRESGESIAPLEPDIVGEHFALACLAQKNLSDEHRTRLCGLAWRLNLKGMMRFTLNAHRDCADHPMLRWVRKLPRSEFPTQFAWSMTCVNLMNDLGPRDLQTALALLDEMGDMAEATDEDAPTGEVRWAWTNVALYEQWAMAASNLIHDLGSYDLDMALDLLEDMHRVAEVLFGAVNWKQWAAALDAGFDVERFVRTVSSEVPLWESWAGAVVTLTNNNLGSCNLDKARQLMAEIHRVAKELDAASLWELWAKAAVNLMIDIAPYNLTETQNLLGDMYNVAEKRGEASLWELWASAAVNVAGYLGSKDRFAARKLLDNMRAVAEARKEAPLRKLWVRATNNLIKALEPLDPVASQALYNEVLALNPEIH